MDLGIEGQIVVVTGAGNGIGAACARAFAEEGCRVAVADVNLSAAVAVANAIRAAGREAIALELDVRSVPSVTQSLSQVKTQWGNVDILVNSAGFSRDGPIASMSDEQWRDVLDVNLTGQFNCIRELAAGMVDRNYGRIINIASRAHFGDVNKSNYSAAKAGVIGLSKALALELGSAGVTINVIAPGIVETERLLNLPHFPDIEARAKAAMPIKRLGQPQEVAAAALFLASAHAAFITGEVLHVSGGRFG
jgi:3-oxoacyl-[acyl-carrier protein] reductase